MSSVAKIDPEIMSGAPCFAGTRVLFSFPLLRRNDSLVAP
jgi:hypothetical protein